MIISEPSLKIEVVKGAGEASTPLSAFDAALNDAGVCNYNLITLSSVIPPGTKVIKTDRYETPDAHWGYKLYCVMAEERCDRTGKYIAAGVGWYQLDDGRGLFVEHHMVGDTQAVVDNTIKLRIENSLKDLCRFRDIPWEEERMNFEISTMEVKGHPASVLVIAVYEAQGWG